MSQDPVAFEFWPDAKALLEQPPMISEWVQDALCDLYYDYEDWVYDEESKETWDEQPPNGLAVCLSRVLSALADDDLDEARKEIVAYSLTIKT